MSKKSYGSNIVKPKVIKVKTISSSNSSSSSSSSNLVKPKIIKVKSNSPDINKNISNDDDDNDDVIDITNGMNSIKLSTSKNYPSISVTNLIKYFSVDASTYWRHKSNNFRKLYYKKINKNQLTLAHDTYIHVLVSLNNIVGINSIKEDYKLESGDDLLIIHKNIISRVSGEIDMLVTDKKNKYVIVDMKTTSTKNIKIFDVASKQINELQLLIYAFMLKKELKLPYIPDCYICAVNPIIGEVVLCKLKIKLELENITNIFKIHPLQYNIPEIYSK